MSEQDCVFCKIVRGELPSVKIYEDDEFIAILDINPNTEGATLVITKEHYPSYIVGLDDSTFCKIFLTAKKVARLLEKGLAVSRCAIVLEGMGINHAHLKLYPLHGVGKEWKPLVSKDRVFFKEYPGYVTTQLGPQSIPEELRRVAERIKKATNNKV